MYAPKYATAKHNVFIYRPFQLVNYDEGVETSTFCPPIPASFFDKDPAHAAWASWAWDIWTFGCLIHHWLEPAKIEPGPLKRTLFTRVGRVQSVGRDAYEKIDEKKETGQPLAMSVSPVGSSRKRSQN